MPPVMANEEGRAQTESVVPHGAAEMWFVDWGMRRNVAIQVFWNVPPQRVKVPLVVTLVRFFPIQRVGLLESAALIRVVGPIQS